MNKLDNMKKLSFGLMRLPHTDPNDPSTVDLEKTQELVDMFMGAGFGYFDTALAYQNSNGNVVYHSTFFRIGIAKMCDG